MKNRIKFSINHALIICIMVFGCFFNCSCTHKSTAEEIRVENITVLEKNFNNDMSNFDMAYNLFNTYLSSSCNEDNKYVKAALVLYDYTYETTGTGNTPKHISYNKYKKLTDIYNKLKSNGENIREADKYAVLSGISLIISEKNESYELAKKSYSANPQNNAFIYAYAEALQGNFNIAYNLLNETLNYNPNNYAAMLKKADICLNMGNYEEAVDICKKLISNEKMVLHAISLAYYCLILQNASDSKIISIIAPQYSTYEPKQAYLRIVEKFLSENTHIGTAKAITKRAINTGNNKYTYSEFAEIFKKYGRIKEAEELINESKNKDIENE